MTIIFPPIIPKLYQYFKKHPWLSCLIANTIFFAIFILFIPIRYESNDDIAMAHLARMGEPHLIFINIIISTFLSTLYNLCNSFEWYTLFLIVTQFVSCTIISKTIACSKRHNDHKYLIICELVILYLFETTILTSLQFTTTAGILAISGLLQLCNTKKKQWIGILLFTIASLIRFDAAMLCGLSFVFIYPLWIYLHGFDKRLFIALTLCVILSSAFQYYNNYYYHTDKEWGEFIEYTKVRGSINDSPNNWRAVNHLPPSVAKETYELFTWYFFPDKNILNLDILKQINHTIIKDTYYKNIPFVKMLHNVPSGLMDFSWELLALLPLFLCNIIFCKNNKERWLWILALIAVPLIVSFISLQSYCKTRVFLCAYFTIILFSAECSTYQKAPFRIKELSLLLLFIPLAIIIYNHYQDFPTKASKQTTEKGIDFTNYYIAYLSPWELGENDTNTIWIGWATGMPCIPTIHSYLELIDNPDYQITINSDCYNLIQKQLSASIYHSYGIKAKPVIVKYTEKSITFYLQNKKITLTH